MTTDTTTLYRRQSKFFKPEKFSKMKIAVIGCGSLGGYIAQALAKLGFRNFSLWDPDTVELHNVPNQPFGVLDVGARKVDAVRHMISEALIVETASQIDLNHNLWQPQEHPLNDYDIIINAPDCIVTREQVARAAGPMAFIVDVRSGPSSLNVYGCHKYNVKAWAFYQNTFFDPNEAITEGCGAQSTVYGSMQVAALAVNTIVNWLHGNPYSVQTLVDLETLSNDMLFVTEL